LLGKDTTHNELQHQKSRSHWLGHNGGGIAALLAGIGVETMLLDIPAKDTQPGDKNRNAIVDGNLKTLQKMRPAQLFSKADLAKIKTGNIDDNLGWLSDVDWVIEVIVERLDIKKSLMAKLVEVIGENTIVTTNTSGLPIHLIAEDMPADFKRRFLGTHFFNPPTLLEITRNYSHARYRPCHRRFPHGIR
jgi:3-hydroxyacyl-CoA dehydrogenase